MELSRSLRARALRHMVVFATLGFATTTAFVNVASAETKSVSVRNANFRQGPSKDDPIQFIAAQYYPVTIIKEKGDWAQVKDFEGEKAWVATRLLSTVPGVVIKSKTCNIREEPTTKSDVVFKVERGEVFKVVKREGDWLNIIDVNGEKGWVHHNLTWGMKDTKSASASKSDKTQEKSKASASKPKAGQKTHVVAKGQNLGMIAKRYNVSVAAIKAANGMKDDMLKIGMKLIIPTD